MRHLLIASLVALLGVSMSAADKINPAFFGTWKLNPAKSKADPGPMVRSQTVTIEPRGDGFTLTADTENADGTTSHTVRIAAFDGKEVSVQGTTNPNAKELYTSISDRSLKREIRIDGQVTNTLTATLSADGKSYTSDTTATNAQGQPVHNQFVLEKQ